MSETNNTLTADLPRPLFDDSSDAAAVAALIDFALHPPCPQYVEKMAKTGAL